jgi:hypothetical protein
MTNRTRTLITVYTRQRIVVQALPGSATIWCQHCSDRVVALKADSVRAALQMGSVNLDRLLEAGSVHAVESGTTPLICGNSLSSHATENEFQIGGEQQ